MQFVGIIKLADRSELIFGPFPSYLEADAFIQEKFKEYKTGRVAYVEGVLPPVLYPNRSV